MAKKNETQTPSTKARDAEPEVIHLRSRYTNYRVCDVEFVQHRATVTPAQMERLRRLREFGPGLDFWIEQPISDAPAPVAAAAPGTPATAGATATS